MVLVKVQHLLFVLLVYLFFKPVVAFPYDNDVHDEDICLLIIDQVCPLNPLEGQHLRVLAMEGRITRISFLSNIVIY